MSKIITNVMIITPDCWIRESDGKWYTHIPFECEEDEDTLIEFVDSNDYIQEHKEDFDALNSGYTKKNVCIISANHKPTCDISIQVKKASEENGRIMYNLKPDGTFEAEWVPNQSTNIMDLLSGLNLTNDQFNDISEKAKDIII